jgi:hypothetical protein
VTEYKLVRIPLRDPASGKPRDRYEAMQSLAHEPWFEQLEHVVSSRGYHVFRRPVDGKAPPADTWRHSDRMAQPDPAVRRGGRR